MRQAVRSSGAARPAAQAAGPVAAGSAPGICGAVTSVGLGAQRVDVDGEPSGDSVCGARRARRGRIEGRLGATTTRTRGLRWTSSTSACRSGGERHRRPASADRRRIRLRRHGPSRRAGPLQEQAHEHGIRERPR